MLLCVSAPREPNRDLAAGGSRDRSAPRDFSVDTQAGEDRNFYQVQCQGVNECDGQ